MNKTVFPAISAKQMGRIDELAPANGLSIEMMMEHAGLHIARFVADYIFKKSAKNGKTAPHHKEILILAGKGHNGGDALAAARHLKNWNFEPHIILCVEPAELKPDSCRQYELLSKTDLKIEIWKSTEPQRRLFKTTDFILDGLLGYPSSGTPRSPVKDLIELANGWGKDVLAIDIPSGLNSDTGKAENPCIKAKATLTLALPKIGLMKAEAATFVGELFVADLGIPDFIFQKAKIEMPVGLFQKNSIVKISGD